MKKIKFTKTSKVRTVNPKDPRDYAKGELSYVEASFEAGKTYEMEEGSANRWLRRGVAQEVSAGKAQPEPVPEQVVTPEPKAVHKVGK